MSQYASISGAKRVAGQLDILLFFFFGVECSEVTKFALLSLVKS